ncbi:SR-related CTD associated factor 8 L homeolog [Xenopus laevis]|nr:SR-related CTD associated factor 8 L homeolog [Xenopus laevis]AAH89292.1 MGC84961 protein [Xenopus laevis]
MDAVKTFNTELYSLNDYKPPISKAKMTQITKAAIKAIKFYKHVVQSVEKFVQKCKPEYKVSGLYVIDSIVRQSRHQFGQDKDLFAPRFSNNIINTFQNLYRCPADEKSKIVRVLNLWQKNNVFKSEIIQPLLDMAAGIPPPVVTPVLPSTTAAMSNTPGTPVTPVTPANIVQGIPDPWIAQINNTDTLAAVAQILQSPQGQQLQQLVQSLHIQQQKPQPSLLQALDAGLVVQLQALTAQLTAAAATSNPLNQLEQSVSLSKKLMDRFDFGDDSNQPEDPKKETQQIPLIPESVNNSIFHQLAEHLQQQNLEHLRQQLLEQQQHSTKVTAQENQDFMSESENSATPSQDDSQQPFLESESQMHTSMNMQQEDMDIEETMDGNEEIFEKEDKKIMKEERPRTRSKSRSRSPRKRRSRSRSGSRKRKHRKRSRSRSRERKRKTSRSYSSERRAREREKERQKKGLPPIRSKTLSVCSTTLWVGQVDKKATQQDLTNVFEEFGQIESINMIPPRGCAYVCMVHRQDSYRALQKLSSSSCKIGSKIIKIAWALNKGVKTEYKQFWDVDLGVTYIPWEKVKVDDLEGFAEGGMIDQESVNNEWKAQKSSAAVGAKESTPHIVTEAPTTIVASAPTPVVTTTTQSTVVQKNSAVSSQPEAYTQPVAVLQIPVAPAVNLVPPAYPVSMTVPPPGYSALPPPPFMRASFNPSQPPPGFIPPPLPPPAIPPPAISSALPAATQSTVTSNTGILAVQPPSPIIASLPHVNIPTRMTGMPLLDVQGLLSQTASARFTLLHPGIPPLPPPPRSMLPPGLIDPNIHPLPFPLGDIVSLPDRSFGVQGRLDSDTVNLKEKRQSLPGNSIQEGDQDYRFPPVENRQNSCKPSTEKHESKTMPSTGNKEMQGVRGTDENVQARNADDDHEPQDMAVVDSSESQVKSMEETCVAHLSSDDLNEDERKPEADAFESLRRPVQQEYDYKGTNILDAHDGQVRQPINDKKLFRGPTIDILPPFQRYPGDREMFVRPALGIRDPFGMPYLETHDHFGRPSLENPFKHPLLDGRNHYGRPPMDGREHFGRPQPDIRENHGRIDSTGKQLHFPLEKPWGHQEDFDERAHHSFTGFQGLKGFHDERHHHANFRQEHRNTPNWNRGFEQATHRDFDDRRHSWERQVDRDERDFDFRREVNGKTFGRERESDNWVPPQPQPNVFEYFPEATSTQNSSKPQVNGENTETSNEKETVSKSDDPELCEQKETSVKESEENDIKETETESQFVVESTETEGT